MTENITYKNAIEEIDTIIKEIETEKVDVDQLTEKLKRAKTLFDICQNKLKNTKKHVDKILDDKQ